jgi:hypothetical protein
MAVSSMHRLTVFVFAVAALVAGAATQASPKRPSGNASVAFAKAKQSILAALKDQGSAQFRNLRNGSDTDRRRVCGEVNAKNAYGGYVGFQKFVYFADTNESFILDEDFGSPSYVREQAKLFGSCF